MSMMDDAYGLNLELLYPGISSEVPGVHMNFISPTGSIWLVSMSVWITSYGFVSLDIPVTSCVVCAEVKILDFGSNGAVVFRFSADGIIS